MDIHNIVNNTDPKNWNKEVKRMHEDYVKKAENKIK